VNVESILGTIHGYSVGQYKLHCPSVDCQNRKKRNLKTLSVNITADKFVYMCHHCGTSGAKRFDEKGEVFGMELVRLNDVQPLSDKGLEWLKSRGITEQTAEKLGIKTTHNYIQSVGSKTECITFPYQSNGHKYASKIRSISEKGFACDGSPKTFFNIDNINPEEPLIICEGEMDCCAFVEASINNVCSVPHGAIMKVTDGRIDPSDDNKFRFIWNAKDIIENAEKVIIATDNDSAGIAMAEEMARRIGKDKCWKLEYPEECKDANDVIVKHGKDVLREIVENAQPYPVAGLYNPSDFYEEVHEIYNKGFGKGKSTGYSNVDEFYSVVEGQLTIVTGHPSSGKSEFVDSIMMNMAREFEWKFSICSFENEPKVHIAKLISKYIGKPFYESDKPRMTEDELEKGKQFVSDHFSFLYQRDGSLTSLDSIIERLRVSVMRYGIRGVVIDPYNYITKANNMSETDYISDMLTRLRVFAQSYGVHVWFVAHPTKMMRDSTGKVPPPKGYDISGSSAWFSKSDCGVTVHRPRPDQDDVTQIMIWKMRFNWIGKQGSTELSFDTDTSHYREYIEPKIIQPPVVEPKKIKIPVKEEDDLPF